MDVSIPMLTKLDNKCGKKILMFGYYTSYQRKTAFLQDGILCRSDIVQSNVISHTAQFKAIRKRDAK